MFDLDLTIYKSRAPSHISLFLWTNNTGENENIEEVVGKDLKEKKSDIEKVPHQN